MHGITVESLCIKNHTHIIRIFPLILLSEGDNFFRRGRGTRLGGWGPPPCPPFNLKYAHFKISRTVKNKVARNGKCNFGFSYTYNIKYGKFWSVLLGHFIKHKPLISEVWQHFSNHPINYYNTYKILTSSQPEDTKSKYFFSKQNLLADEKCLQNSFANFTEGIPM